MSGFSKTVSTSTLMFLLVCGVIFVIGYAASLHLLRSSIVNLTTRSVSGEVEVIGNYVDSKLQNVEEILYAITWAEDRHGTPFYFQDYDYSEEELFDFLEDILSFHPDVCGVAFGMDPEQKFFPPPGRIRFCTLCYRYQRRNEAYAAWSRQ